MCKRLGWVDGVVADAEGIVAMLHWFVHALCHAAKVELLVRGPFDCLSSLRRHDWMDPPQDERALDYYALHWVRLAHELRRAPSGMLVGPEEFVSGTGTLVKLRDYSEMSHLDASFIAKNQVNGGVKSDSALRIFSTATSWPRGPAEHQTRALGCLLRHSHHVKSL
jgi:hypothetical protein